MTARTVVAIASLARRARRVGRLRQLLRDPGRDADPGEARRLDRSSACSSPASSPAARRAIDPEHRNGAAAAQPAAHQVRPARDRRRRAVARRRGRQVPHGEPAPRRSGRPDEPRIKTDEGPEGVRSDLHRRRRSGRSSARSTRRPLIVTGSILFTEIAKSGMVSQPADVTEPARPDGVPDGAGVQRPEGLLARRRSSSSSTAGPAQQLYSESFHEEALYPTARTRRRCRPTSS